MKEKSINRERRLLKTTAAILIGAGALTACSTVVEGTPVAAKGAATESTQPGMGTYEQPIQTEAPVPNITPEQSLSRVTVDELVRPSELAPRSPKNDTSRCIFSVVKAATMRYIDDPSTTATPDPALRKDAYTYKSGDTAYSVTIHHDIHAKKLFFDFDGSFTDGLSVSGSMLIPATGSAQESLNAIDSSELIPNTVVSTLYHGYTVNQKSSIYRHGQGASIKDTLGDETSDRNCANAVDIINSLH